ncbi:hypothetical protein [Mycobacterium sp.]|uniref:hypothetical protein n=1 Tax=Mycobacterium sp. TaxID=1785 RepID=UPI002CB394CE|nr:hypothetical protein [Mycobacterium sp.]HTY35413.1 hypothetical protein [Mycobacterium sp.]
MTNDDLRITLARIEAKLDVTLPAHSERLNEHARILDAHDVRLRAVEQAGAAVNAGTAQARRLPNWVPVVAAFAGVAAVIVAAIALTK